MRAGAMGRAPVKPCVFVPQRPVCAVLWMLFSETGASFRARCVSCAAVTVSLETCPCTWSPDIRSLILHLLPLGNGQAARRATKRHLGGMWGKMGMQVWTLERKVDRSMETELCTATDQVIIWGLSWNEWFVTVFWRNRDRGMEVSLCLSSNHCIALPQASGTTPANRSILPIKVHPKRCCTFWPCTECNFAWKSNQTELT